MAQPGRSAVPPQTPGRPGRPAKGIPGLVTPPRPVEPPAALEPLPEKPPYFKFAAANPYNLSLLAGGLAASALTLNPIIALAALGESRGCGCFGRPTRRRSRRSCGIASSRR